MFTAEMTKCKLCGCPARIIRRADGSADHYEALERDEMQEIAAPVVPTVDRFLRSSREGKRTVAIVGSAWTTRAWAPYGEENVEVWCFNEMHGQSGVGKATRWFQLHPKWEFMKDHRLRHWEWLRGEHGIPIYMQRDYDAVPNAVMYPLRDVMRALVTKGWKGEERIEKVFGSSFAYAVALALYERRFDRIELFGIEMALEAEWAYQRESMAFWLGRTEGMGIEWWMPEQCQLFHSPLYAYEQVMKGDGSIVLPPDGGRNGNL